MEESQLKYSEDHFWILEMGESIRVGLSDYAQEQLGEILTLTLAEVGKFVEQGDPLGELESQKTVVELICPVSGTVRAVNESAMEDPSLINVDPYGKGWLVELEIEDPEGIERLMTHEEYETFIED